jgi:hypothetical protein
MKRKGLLLFACIFMVLIASAQNLLNKSIAFEVKNQRLDNVLEILSNKGNFFFSYNSNIIKGDSLVTLSIANRTVRQVLDQLLSDHYQFRESGNYIIIRKEPITLTVVTNKALTEDNFYTVSGYVLDDESGNWIHNASIYEKQRLASTLTNSQGYFRLRLKQKTKEARLTVSKDFYRDTTFAIDPGYNQQFTITLLPVTAGLVTIISPDDYFAPEQLKLRVKTDSTITEYTYTKTDSAKVERTGLGRFLTSSQQRIQSLNLKQFFTTRPFQVSFTPGLGTHGNLSAQVVNNFSFNILGGYNGGVNGFELGGLFNIEKKSVQYLQIGGLFNIVGGRVNGVQIGGINNTVLDAVHGLQIGGVSNLARGKFDGFQLSGVYNHVSHSVKGMQLAGVGNFAKNNVSGTQVAGVLNISNRVMKGTQISGVLNYAKTLKGVQIGLINIADSSDGYSIGLINIVLKGYHKLSLSADELLNLNAAFKTGNAKLYSILKGGMNVSDSQKLYTFGYGIGTAIRDGKTFSINPELMAQQLHFGSWTDVNILSKATLNLNVRLGKYVSLFAAPVFNVYYSTQQTVPKGYRAVIPPAGYRSYDLGRQVKGWLGWNAGITFF